MSKLFQKTVSFTFTVEHVSDDPAYEHRLTEAINEVVVDCNISSELTAKLITHGLRDQVVAGGAAVAPTPIANTHETLIHKLTETLSEFREDDTSISLHLTFQDVGPLRGDNEELWWDENLLQFIPEEPQ